MDLVLLAVRSHAENLTAAKRILEARMPVRVSAIAQYEDEANELSSVGVHEVFDLNREAGTAFADHSCAKLWNSGEPKER